MPDAIRARRAAGGVRFLVTGATGFLGAHVTRALLRRGHRVTALVREARNVPAPARFGRVADWLGLRPEEKARATVVAGDAAEERFGLGAAAWGALAAGTEEVVHCAASTAFAERRRAELERVNVGGTAAALACAAEGRATSFHLISSAYAAGRLAEPADGVWREQSAFANPYEETKHRSERLAIAACAEAGIRLSVYRPAIVCGDSETGRSLRFNALYHPVRTLLFLRDLPEAAAIGIEPLPGGGARIPVRLEAHPEAALNLVPVDRFERAFLALLEGAPAGGFFPIVAEEDVPLGRVVEFVRRRWRIEGLETATADAFTRRPRTPLETLFDGFVAPYRPYLTERRRFVPGAADPILARAGARDIPFTEEVFSRVMRFAEDVAWGRRLW
jgi:nucleoside-diphosphate-sugar epimerase